MAKRDEISTMNEKKVYNFNLPSKSKSTNTKAPATAKKKAAPSPQAPARMPTISSDSTGTAPRKYPAIARDQPDAVSASKEKNALFRMAKVKDPDTPGGLVWKLQMPKFGVYKNGGAIRGDGMSRVKTKGKCC